MPVRFNFSPLTLFLILPIAAAAQSPAQASEQQPHTGFTLNTAARIVLTDVTVTDHAGNIIHGLPASAFHVTVDKQPRPILSFEEQSSAPTAITAAPVAGVNTYSNEYLKHLPPVLNIIVLDTSNLGITEQMYLAIKFNKFLANLSADQPLAIYARVGEHLILIQNFTADRALLKAAAAKVMPRLPVPHDTASDADALFDICNGLVQVPGHKNVLWFSGGSGLLQIGDPEITENAAALQKIYDLLEAARISIYPIDARGLEVNPNPAAIAQHMQMHEIADNTGGEALYNRNFLDQLAHDVLRNDSSFYTLTFSPKDFQADNKWHRISIKLDHSGYNLSYRHGFFADGNNLAPPIQAKPSHRNLLLAGGKTVEMPADAHSTPIIFTASVVPSAQATAAPDDGSDYFSLHAPVPAKPGQIAYFIRYTLPADAFLTRTSPGNKPLIDFDVAAIAFNQGGEKVAGKGDHVRLTLAADHSSAPICIEQQIDLRKGDSYLYLAVWDTATGRLGTIQVPVTVK